MTLCPSYLKKPIFTLSFLLTTLTSLAIAQADTVKSTTNNKCLASRNSSKDSFTTNMGNCTYTVNNSPISSNPSVNKSNVTDNLSMLNRFKTLITHIKKSVSEMTIKLKNNWTTLTKSVSTNNANTINPSTYFKSSTSNGMTQQQSTSSNYGGHKNKLNNRTGNTTSVRNPENQSPSKNSTSNSITLPASTNQNTSNTNLNPTTPLPTTTNPAAISVPTNNSSSTTTIGNNSNSTSTSSSAPTIDSPIPATSLSSTQAITVNLTETPEAFKNPMKGFRRSRYIQDSAFPEQEYGSTYKHYIKYTDLETDAGDSAQKIKEWSNTAWAGIEKSNIKVIPRVVISYPNGPDGGKYWANGIPHDGSPNDWLSDTLKSRLLAFIAKLGEAWDNDPRVAAIELGLWGNWGESHIWPDKLPDGTDRIPASFQEALGNAYTQAFHNKKIMVRYPETFTNFNFGYIWDSFALPDDASGGNGIIARSTWTTQMVSGEVAYDWGDQSKLGGSPNGTLSSTSNTDNVISWIQSTHASSLGWIAEYDAGNSAAAANAARMQKEFGYRYVINTASFSSVVQPGSALSISFNVTNKGNAPFYYGWPVKAALLNENKSVAWSESFNADIKSWLPGSANTVSQTFTVPSTLSVGTYTLVLSVNDPAGDHPSIRFANTNYYKGGWTPIGKVGIGQQVSDQNIEPFDGLKSDSSLSYSLSF